jgi:hypothetical protein
MAYCPNCGVPVSPEALACTRCGADFGDHSAWRPSEQKPLRQLARPIPSRILRTITYTATVIGTGIFCTAFVYCEGGWKLFSYPAQVTFSFVLLMAWNIGPLLILSLLNPNRDSLGSCAVLCVAALIVASYWVWIGLPVYKSFGTCREIGWYWALGPVVLYAISGIALLIAVFIGKGAAERPGR